ncbi:MAG: S9 family peptidase [bacterium]|nr:S9 family peptidase [bacterium]
MPKRPITPDDLYRIITLEDPRLSPDGRWIAFTRVQPDKFENNYVRNIWIVPTAGGDPVQITRGNKDSAPAWSPDSTRIAFQSGRGADGKPQIYVVPVTAPGGEARPVTRMLNGATHPSWSPDGRTLAFLSAASADEREREDRDQDEKNIPPRDKLESRHRQERWDHDNQKRLDPYPVWRIPYRTGTTFTGERYAHVYIVDAEADKPQPRRLTQVEANHEPPTWAADGAWVYTARQTDPAADEPTRTSAIYRVRTADGHTEALTGEEATTFTPLPSPDGRWIACTRFPRTGPPVTERLTHLGLFAAPASGQPIDSAPAIRDVNAPLDSSVQHMAWKPDSSEIVFIANWHGSAPIYAAAPDGTLRKLAEGRFRAAFLDAGEMGVAFVASTPECPQELYFLPYGGEMIQRTHFNQGFLDDVQVQQTHEFWVQSPDGNTVHGWYLLPVGYEEGKQYPLALNIHGGPHVMWSTAEPSMFLEWQFHAARGYVVLATNPRGSDGYGEGYLQAIHENWGDTAMRDILAGVDHVIGLGMVDADRLALTGGSYGGYMVAWIIGHTDRFKAAVAQRGVYNLLSFYGTSDVPSLISGEFAAEPWENPDKLWAHSPLAYAHHMRTPLLIEHAEQDYRVPIEQAEQLFAYVHRSGGVVKMLRYPREGHEKSRSGEPAHRVDRLIHMVNWFDRYCKGAAAE